MLDQLNESQLDILETIQGKSSRINKFEFSLKLEEYVQKEKTEYITALREFTELYDIDYENVNKYLTEPIKQKIAMENGLLNTIYGINNSLI